jgi:hypothetical protein
MHGDFPRVGCPPMLEKIDSLPGSQSEAAVPDRNGQLQAGQRGAEVGGHVVGAFICVAVSPRLLWRQAVEERLEIDANLSGRVLLNEQAGRGVPADKVRSPVRTPWGLSQSTISGVISTSPRPGVGIRTMSTN